MRAEVSLVLESYTGVTKMLKRHKFTDGGSVLCGNFGPGFSFALQEAFSCASAFTRERFHSRMELTVLRL